MNPLETYQSDAVERPLLRRRLIWALILSLLIHACVVLWFHQTRLPQFNAPTERLVPRIFKTRTITLPEDALNGADKPQASKTPDQKPSLTPLNIPDEKPTTDISEGKMSPTAPTTQEVVKPLQSDKPIVDAESLQAIQRVQDSAAKAMDQDLASLKDKLLKDQPPNVSASVLKLPDGSTGAQSDAAGMAQASGRLDKLLGHGLHPGDAPVTLPGGALFEFASSDLRTAAIDQLRKLGMLIKQSPDVTFTIEGYTDSFGDAAYNVQLSQARADSVRNWLIQNMDVDPAHILAIGYGATRFLVRPELVDMHSQASIDKEKLLEQPNRRVEIRFKFPKAQ